MEQSGCTGLGWEQFLDHVPRQNGVYPLITKENHRGVTMPSHSDVAKRIFDDAKEHTNRHEDSAQWDLLTGLSELCLAVESLEVEVRQMKADMKKLQDGT
jgi:hypothetical protein